MNWSLILTSMLPEHLLLAGMRAILGLEIKSGRSRDGFGFLSRSICSAEKPTNTPKKSAMKTVGSRPAIWAPISEPTRMPGASTLTTGHSTAPRL